MGAVSNPGWYPDPGGAQGMYRYWDGSQWSSTVSSTPGASASPPSAPASPGSTAGTPPAQPPTPDASAPSGATDSHAAYYGGTPLLTRAPAPNPYAGASGWSGNLPRARRESTLKTVGWWLLTLALLGALIFGGLQLLRAVGLAPGGGSAASNPTSNPCPTTLPTGAELVPKITADGRVQGGKLSYPMLGAPWSPPKAEERMAFGRDVFTQNVMVEPLFDGKLSWVASVLVGELVAGDGFFSPQQGADMVVRCAMGEFYSDAVVTRDDKVSKAVTVSGKDGWLIETHLSFDIPKLNEKGEMAIFEIVQTSATSSSIYYASIPDSRPELLTTARQVQQQLRVEP